MPLKRPRSPSPVPVDGPSQPPPAKRIKLLLPLAKRRKRITGDRTYIATKRLLLERKRRCLKNDLFRVADILIEKSCKKYTGNKLPISHHSWGGGVVVRSSSVRNCPNFDHDTNKYPLNAGMIATQVDPETPNDKQGAPVNPHILSLASGPSNAHSIPLRQGDSFLYTVNSLQPSCEGSNEILSREDTSVNPILSLATESSQEASRPIADEKVESTSGHVVDVANIPPNINLPASVLSYCESLASSFTTGTETGTPSSVPSMLVNGAPPVTFVPSESAPGENLTATHIGPHCPEANPSSEWFSAQMAHETELHSTAAIDPAESGPELGPESIYLIKYSLPTRFSDFRVKNGQFIRFRVIISSLLKITL